MKRSRTICFPSWLLGAAFSFVSLAPFAYAQGPGAPATRVGTGKEKLDVAKNWDTEARDEQKEFDRLRKGERAVTEDDKTLLDNAAMWFAYRLTWDQHQDPATFGKNMHDLVKQAFGQIIDRSKPANAAQLAFKDEFEKYFVARLADVTKNPKPIARVNAAIILARLAETGQEGALDVLLDIIQDPTENDGVKLFAFRGLRSFFNLGRAEDTSPFQNKDREAKCAQVLMDYIAQKPAKLPANPRELAAVTYVRADAVAALGLSRFPAVSNTVKKKTTVDRRAALTLLKVLRKDGIVPEPGIAEQVNAAVGLCQLRSKLCDEYQPDYTAYEIGRFLVDFFSRYNEERDLNPKTEPWKIHAARLSQALEELKADTERNNAKTYIAKFVSQAQGQLIEITKGTNQLNPADMANWLDANKPASATVYKDVPEAVVKETQKTEQ